MFFYLGVNIARFRRLGVDQAAGVVSTQCRASRDGQIAVDVGAIRAWVVMITFCAIRPW